MYEDMILSERYEDQLKAVKWIREQMKLIPKDKRFENKLLNKVKYKKLNGSK